MDLKALKDTPPWDWPTGTRKLLLDILRDDQSAETDRLLATELAGDFTVISDDVAEALLSILRRSDLSERVAQPGGDLPGAGPRSHGYRGLRRGFPDHPHRGTDLPHAFRRRCRRSICGADVPKDVRRRILEASVRAPQDWHPEAVREAYASRDEAWRLTAVFCMSYVPGFDEQILEGLDSENRDIRYEAVLAAGTWEVDAAWPHVEAIITSEKMDKSLLLAAIDAVASIRPHEAAEILLDLSESDDDDIVEAVDEALAMAGGLSDVDYEDEDDDDEEEVIH